MSMLFSDGYSYKEFMRLRHCINYDELKKWHLNEYGRTLVVDISDIDIKEKIFLILSEPGLYRDKAPDILYENFSLVGNELTMSNYRTAMHLLADEFSHADRGGRLFLQNGFIIILNTLLSNADKFNIVVGCLPKFLFMMPDKKIKYMFDSNKEFTRAFLYMICASDDDFGIYMDIMDNDKLSDDTTNLSNECLGAKYNLAMTNDRHIIMLLFLRREWYMLNKLDKMGKLNGNYSYGSLTPRHIARYHHDEKLKTVAIKYTDEAYFFSEYWLAQFVPLYMIRLGSIYIELLKTTANNSTRDVVIRYPYGDKIMSEFIRVDQFNTNCNVHYMMNTELQPKLGSHTINILETTRVAIKWKPN
jgi:hypothetical protein